MNWQTLLVSSAMEMVCRETSRKKRAMPRRRSPSCTLWNQQLKAHGMPTCWSPVKAPAVDRNQFGKSNGQPPGKQELPMASTCRQRKAIEKPVFASKPISKLKRLRSSGNSSWAASSSLSAMTINWRAFIKDAGVEERGWRIVPTATGRRLSGAHEVVNLLNVY